ncbi:MAG TPA: hypothetical protein VHO24_17095 [Opitutaceae bacterium]|nr:hypothetical protein [Opitutaceae bacterium]
MKRLLLPLLLAVAAAAAPLARAVNLSSWDRPEIAVPVSFAIGLGGLAWMVSLIA